MKKIVSNISLAVIILFSAVGAFLSGVLIHELSHYQDFKKYADSIDVCYLSFPTNFSVGNTFFGKLGYTYTEYNQSDESKVLKVSQIKKYTEIKAYGIMSLFWIIFIICFFIVLNRWIKDDTIQEISYEKLPRL